ncbi:unnamed protein product [Lymnaea stagnalis]|uniref:Protein kinase domain-containing protein n=1 Tax=Lymnaea stagnalis TaxID=6523 RepID=A0AAV2H5X3_LYMST
MDGANAQVPSDYHTMAAQIAARGNTPEDWKEYIDSHKTKVAHMDDCDHIRMIDYLYRGAFKLIPDSNKTSAKVKLLLDYAEFRSLNYSLSESEKVLSYGRRKMGHLALIHIACAELELKRGNKERALKILYDAASARADPVSNIHRAVQRIAEGKTELITDDEKENDSFDLSPVSNKESSDEWSCSAFSGTFGLSKESVELKPLEPKTNNLETKQDVESLPSQTSAHSSMSSNEQHERHQTYLRLSVVPETPQNNKPTNKKLGTGQRGLTHYHTTPNLMQPFGSGVKSKFPIKNLGPPRRVKVDPTMKKLRDEEDINSVEITDSKSQTFVSQSNPPSLVMATCPTPERMEQDDGFLVHQIPMTKATGPGSCESHFNNQRFPPLTSIHLNSSSSVFNSLHSTMEDNPKALDGFVMNASMPIIHQRHQSKTDIEQHVKRNQDYVCNSGTDRPGQNTISRKLWPLTDSAHMHKMTSYSSALEPSTADSLMSKDQSNDALEKQQVHKQTQQEQQQQGWQPPKTMEAVSSSVTYALPASKLSLPPDDLMQISSSHSLAQSVLQNQFQAQSVLPNQSLPQYVLHNQPLPQSVLPNQLQAQSVLPNQLQAHSVLPNQLQAQSVLPNQLQAQSVLPNHLQCQSVLPNQLQGQSVLPNQLQAHSFLPNQLQPQSVLPNQFQAQSVIPCSSLQQSIIPSSMLQFQHSIPNTPLSNNEMLPVGNGMGDEKVVYVNQIPYKVLRLVGRGGSAKVYQVYDPMSNMIRALKVVNLSMANEVVLEGYINEISLLKKLQHCDRVIKLFDSEYVESKKKLIAVLEYGETDLDKFLSQNLKGQNQLSPITVCYYWSQMVTAVHAMHEEGVIHSDLKPANFILVSGNVKLIDFGIANSIQIDCTSVIKEIKVGTPSYMSPEALMASNNAPKPKFKLGKRSDVWSLGCILYQMVYGHTPFQYVRDKLNAIVNPEHTIQFPDKGDPALMDVLKRCLNRDVSQRPTTDELLNHPYLKKQTTEEKPGPNLAANLKMIEEGIAESSPMTKQKYIQRLIKELATRYEGIQNT